MQDKLDQILQALQQNATSSQDIVINENGPANLGNTNPTLFGQGMTSKADTYVQASIQRLGQLVHEKERTFDVFDSTNTQCNSIIEDLSNILNTAKQHATDQAQGEVAFAVAKFSKAHASHVLTINAQGMN